MKTSRWRPVLGAIALVGVLTGCEAGVELNAGKRLAPNSPAPDAELRALARTHSAQACAAGTVLTSPDPDATYGPGTVELVDRAPLDPGRAEPQDEHEATNAIWSRWNVDPRLDAGPWDRMAAGQARCADGNLYMTLLLQADGPAGFAPGVIRVTEGDGAATLAGITSAGDTVAIRYLQDLYLYDVATDTLTPTGVEPLAPSRSASLSSDGSTLLFGQYEPESEENEGEFSYTIDALDIATGTTSRRYNAYNRTSRVRAASGDGSRFVQQTFGPGGSTFTVIRLGDTALPLDNSLFGTVSASFSDDGRYLATVAYNAEVRDLSTGTTTMVGPDCLNVPDGDSTSGAGLSGTGRYLAYACWDRGASENDTDLGVDLFVWDRTTGQSQRITSGSDGRALTNGPDVSDDGRFVVYSYERPDPGSRPPADTYIWDRATGISTLIAPITADVAISGDGSVVTFVGVDPDQTRPNYTDLYVWENPAA